MGRTKGSKNGISTTKGYTAIGKKAVGILDNAGNYIYKSMQEAKSKLKTKDFNPSMPGATAKYLDKKNEARQAALEKQRKIAAKIQAEAQAKQMAQQQKQAQQPQPTANTQAFQQPQQQNQQTAPQQQPVQAPKQATDKKQGLINSIKDKIPDIKPNQNGNTANTQQQAEQKPQQTEQKSSNKKSLIGMIAELATNKEARDTVVGKVKKGVKKVADKVEEKAVETVGPDEIKKMAKGELKGALDKVKDTREGPRKGTNAEGLGNFIKADIQDRAEDVKNKAVKKGKEYLTNTLNRALEDPRMKDELKDMAKTGYYKGEKEAIKQVASKITDPSSVRKYSSVALDAAVPTYDKRKASDKNRFTDFVKADIQDRINDAKKKAKDKAVDKITSSTSKITKDKRMQDEVKMFKEDPEKAIKKIVNDYKNDPDAKKKYKSVAADIVMPTYEDRKADLDDNFFDFIMNDIQDRHNDTKKKIKKKVVNW